MAVGQIDKKPAEQELLRQITAYAHLQVTKVIADGIETREELETVLRLDCDFLQGVYLAEPRPWPQAELKQGAKEETTATAR